ncbi:hypothetical protein C453_17804 [Haloferax elongans ATCC BAA-1513]|uniref:Uncharacterized protein n=1 Tax=Haloferax elongans ATCC BAA-1513 TaxID=1230453 RepID=M0HBM0_HALEO|nr:hypothetical protein [Haloferax elongans]ELZ81895.1 hypothetical protein C453_17804 [Haloferax elongans ATCC BAA-1513]
MVPALRTPLGIVSGLSLGMVIATGYALFSPRPPTQTYLTGVFVLSVCLSAAGLWLHSASGNAEGSA